MTIDLSLLSHAAAALSFLLIAILVSTKYLRRSSDRSLLLAAVVSVIWAMSLVSQNIWSEPSFFVRYLLELLRDAAWIIVLFALIRDSSHSDTLSRRLKRILGFSCGTLICALLLSGAAEYFFGWHILGGKAKVMGQIALSLMGICVVEQIWRNAISFGRSSMKYVCIGIGAIFIYDFFMYSDALLFGHLSETFWSARGAVNALIAPLFAVNMINTRRQPVDFQLSRNAIFHASTLVFAGIYLIISSVGGYYVRTMGGEWGAAFQVIFLSSCLLLFAALLTSRRFRARLMMFVSKNFFDYKYDYREEWLKMTQIFANMSEDPPLPERVVRVMAGLVESNAGALWIKDDDGNYTLSTSINIVPPKRTRIDDNEEMVRYLRGQEWIIDLEEYHDDPTRYNLLEIPDSILAFPDGWLIIPLYLADDLYGICLIGTPYTKVQLNWENFDLVRVVARQSSNVLAQADAQDRLSHAMQFEAVSKASAFMVHDLKTMIAQLSLLVSNASKHRDNPAFISDMITTTDHAVRKLSNMVDHIRRPDDEQVPTKPIDLAALITSLAEEHSRKQPTPVVNGNTDPVWIEAETEQLRSVLGHLITNAQDATPPEGDVLLSLKQSDANVVVFIQDNGAGMSVDFIKNKLFKPFDSTKGLAGMGIGAYQAREYVRRIGGNIDVTSDPGFGSCFSARFPLYQFDDVEASDSASSQPEPETETPVLYNTGPPLQ